MIERNHWWREAVAFGLGGVIGIAGCTSETTPEGTSTTPVADTVNRVKEKASDAAAVVGEKAGEVKVKVVEGAKTASEATGKVVEKAGVATEKAGENLQNAARQAVKEKAGETAAKVVEGAGKVVEKSGGAVEGAGKKLQNAAK